MVTMQSNPETRSTTATRRAANPPRYLHVSAYARMIPMPLTGSQVAVQFKPWVEKPGQTFLPYGQYDRKAYRRGKRIVRAAKQGRHGTFKPRKLGE